MRRAPLHLHVGSPDCRYVSLCTYRRATGHSSLAWPLALSVDIEPRTDREDSKRVRGSNGSLRYYRLHPAFVSSRRHSNPSVISGSGTVLALHLGSLWWVFMLPTRVETRSLIILRNATSRPAALRGARRLLLTPVGRGDLTQTSVRTRCSNASGRCPFRRDDHAAVFITWVATNVPRTGPVSKKSPDVVALGRFESRRQASARA
jgi:hypothetical protein